MENQSDNTKYPEYFALRYRAPQINLPFYKTHSSIFTFYTLENVGPRKTAICQICEQKIEMIWGSSVYSSYSARLKFHLRKHTKEWLDYLDYVAEKMVPDIKTKFEHFQRMNNQRGLSKDEKTEIFGESDRNEVLNRKNLAGVNYMNKDLFYLQNRKSNIFSSAEGENARIFEYIHSFTNRNVPLVELIGRMHPNPYLHKKYRKSKNLVENVENITLDLERLFCEHMCFFDPANYDDCPNQHMGDIAIFGDENYQRKVLNLDEELDKYPELMDIKTFDHVLLKEVKVVENDNHAVIEMNRLLKIILSMITVKKKQMKSKVEQIVADNTGDDNLVKPPLAIQMWGPKFIDIDDKSLIKTIEFAENMFSTYQHVKDEDCPAYKDESKRIHTEPYLYNGSVVYPCNVGGCAKRCECEGCNFWYGDEILNCPDHHPDHPMMFNPEEDILIYRRMLFDPKYITPNFDRPKADSRWRLKLAGMKKECQICKQVVKDHLKNHHSSKLHTEVCEICAHLEFISQNSFALICYVCMKKFEDKYRLEDHMNVHKPDNLFTCKLCDKSFTTKFTQERHMNEIHVEKRITLDCDRCDAKFSSERNLRRHLKDAHSENINQYECSACEAYFKRKDNLLQHMREVHDINERKAVLKGVNDEEIEYECPFCEKVFKRKSKLKRHKDTVHVPKYAYICETCGKSFSRKDYLTKHEKIHMKINIICEICRQHFPSKEELKTHRLELHENK